MNTSILFTIDWRLGVLFFIPIPVALYINTKSYRRFTPIWVQWEKWKKQSNGSTAGALINIRTVQAYVQEERECASVENVRENMRVLDTKNSIKVERWFFAINFFLNFFFVGTIFAGVALVLATKGTIGTLVYVIATGNVVLQNTWQIIDIYLKIARYLVAVERMRELLDAPVEVTSRSEKALSDAERLTFHFKKVNFNYSGQKKEAVKHFSHKINPGEMVAIVGRSGSGKTTITKVLTRTHDVTSGGVYLNNIDIRYLSRDWYRKQFAIVQQDGEIFDDTLLENVRYAHPEASDDMVIAALKAAHLNMVLDDKERFPLGIGTPVGERGVRLSGGERQRVTIARAILALQHGAKVLILDEATSSLDSEAERAIQQMIQGLRKKSEITIVAIAHRLSTIQKADQICVLEKGKIVERGNHERLMKKNGLYSRLVKLQKLKEVRK